MNQRGLILFQPRHHAHLQDIDCDDINDGTDDFHGCNNKKETAYSVCLWWKGISVVQQMRDLGELCTVNPPCALSNLGKRYQKISDNVKAEGSLGAGFGSSGVYSGSAKLTSRCSSKFTRSAVSNAVLAKTISEDIEMGLRMLGAMTRAKEVERQLSRQ
jgi:hypothetical protein